MHSYLNFFGNTANDLFGTNFVLSQIILPLGISFITFQKIAFLIDVHGGRVKSFTLEDYCLFVLFFPQLIAGPIVHYQEMMPQFKGRNFQFDKENLAVGATLFFAGLFKKVVLADSIAPLVTPIYEQSTHGGVSLLLAWMAAVGFTLQLYFDFSAYTDMALGSARFFGIRLPVNFNSPLKAASIIEFWQRWNMTLTRFLMAYIYNPLVLKLTRRRLAKGKQMSELYGATLGTFIYLVAFPMLLTMLVSGIWHGAGYTFIVWGLLHGCYLTINHAWRVVTQKIGKDWTIYEGLLRPISIAVTFICVSVSMVFFRSSTIKSSMNLITGMLGFNGVSLPNKVLSALGPIGRGLKAHGVTPDLWNVNDFGAMTVLIPFLLFVALVCPNMLEILDRYEPALGFTSGRTNWLIKRLALKWDTSLRWAIFVSIAAMLGIIFIGNYSEFLYWQF